MSRFVWLAPKCLVAAAVLAASSTFARPIEIIHTNDLHSHFDHTDNPEFGGYAAVKAVMDRLKSEAQSQGIESLVLDAGDFSEGTPYFFADDGAASWKIIQSMGYDTIVMGNHDWLIGLDLLERIVGQFARPFQFVSANFRVSQKFPALYSRIRPYHEHVRSGLKIAVLGLSTPEDVYKWRLGEGKITDPYKAAKKYIQQLRSDHDAIIALTHLGVEFDSKLVEKTEGLDLVVGGHSHTVLTAPIMAKDPSNKTVPIVQTGEHGNFVGDLLVDIEPGKPLEVLRYQLIPVRSDGAKDPVVQAEVARAHTAFESKFGKDWLHEVIGMSDVAMEKPTARPTTWSRLVAEAYRDVSGADVSLDVSEFFGSSQPAGPITREMLMSYYPRTFDSSANGMRAGWNVWDIRAQGWLIKRVMREAYGSGRLITTAGLTYETGFDTEDQAELSNFKVNGKKMGNLNWYRVAVSEGIGRGSREMNRLFRTVFGPRDTGVSVWEAIERRVNKLGGVVHSDMSPRALK